MFYRNLDLIEEKVTPKQQLHLFRLHSLIYENLGYEIHL